MDFVVRLPLIGRKHDSVWVAVDQLTKSAHFLPVRIDYSLDKFAELYIEEIVRLHGIPVSIISDRDPRFNSRFWENYKRLKALGKISTWLSTHRRMDNRRELFKFQSICLEVV